MTNYKIHTFPNSRLVGIDLCKIGKQKHHVSGLVEFDVTLSRKKIGNVAFTFIGMMGKVNGWFIPISVHPICFGISSIIKKPTVIDDRIEIREMLNMSILIDHDVIDGAQMARMVSDLSKNIENGVNL